MNITQGIYAGWNIVVHMIPQTSGQIAVSARSTIDKWRPVFCEKITVDQIRSAFNITGEDFGFVNILERTADNEKEFGFQWTFMFDRLSGKMSQYEFLSCIFKGIDKLNAFIRENLGEQTSKE